MIIIKDKKNNEGISFLYPLFLFCGPQRLKLIPISNFKNKNKLPFLLNIFTAFLGIFLIFPENYSDNLYDLFALMVILIAAISIWKMRGGKIIHKSEIQEAKTASIAIGMEFSLLYFSLGIMEFIYLTNSKSKVEGILFIIGLVFFFISAVPYINYFIFKARARS